MLPDEEHMPPTSWGWLRGFGWFLLAWPLMSLAAADEFDGEEWETILIAVLGPGALGALLLFTEAAVSRFFGAKMAAQGVPLPNTLRDISNTALTFALLTVILIALAAIDEPDTLADSDGLMRALTVFGVFAGIALVFRALAVWRHGPPRRVDGGALEYDDSPGVVRFIGYLTLVPSLLVATVMTTEVIADDGGFGVTSWVVQPAFLCLGLRSAMARSPRYWARSEQEAWTRATSLAVPWWTLVALLCFGLAALCVLLPFNLDGSLSVTGQILSGIFMAPLGLLLGGFTFKQVWAGGASLIRTYRRHREVLSETG